MSQRAELHRTRSGRYDLATPPGTSAKAEGRVFFFSWMGRSGIAGPAHPRFAEELSPVHLRGAVEVDAFDLPAWRLLGQPFPVWL